MNEGQLSGLNQSLGSAQQVIVKQGATLEVLPKAEVTKPSENGFVTETLTSTAKNGHCNGRKRWSFLTE